MEYGPVVYGEDVVPFVDYGALVQPAEIVFGPNGLQIADAFVARQALLIRQRVDDDGGAHSGGLRSRRSVRPPLPSFLRRLRFGAHRGGPSLAQHLGDSQAEVHVFGVSHKRHGGFDGASLQRLDRGGDGVFGFGRGADELQEVADTARDEAVLGKADVALGVAVIDGVLQRFAVHEHAPRLVGGGAVAQRERRADGEDGVHRPDAARHVGVELAPNALHAVVIDGTRRAVLVLDDDGRSVLAGYENVGLGARTAKGVPKLLPRHPPGRFRQLVDDTGDSAIQLFFFQRHESRASRQNQDLGGYRIFRIIPPRL